MRERAERLGRYELLLELARGGMAELFLGRLHGAGGFAKLVAIKRILPHLAHDPQFKAMFLEEGRIASHLSHPNVCQVFELDEVDDQLFLAMEYLDGVSWDHLLRAVEPGAQLQPLVVGVLAQAAEGLHYAHTLRDAMGQPAPVVHRDISPQNLFVTVDGICKVLDFGVAKMQGADAKTKSGVIKGKLPYMAPEQIRGEPLDGRADIFSLGVVAWEALAGRRLFDRESDYQIWKAITEEPIPPCGAHPALEAVVQRALARDRSYRPPTARAFADELRAGVSAATPGQIAEAVRTSCGDRLAARATQVATVLSRRSGPLEPGPSDTVRDEPGVTADDMAIRDHSLVLGREPDAGSTVRARPSRPGQPAPATMLGETRSPLSTPQPHTAPTPSVAAHLPAQRRRAIWPFLVGALALATIIVIAAVLANDGDRPAEVARDRAPTELDRDPSPTDELADVPARLEHARRSVDEAMKNVDQANRKLRELGLDRVAMPTCLLSVDSQPPATIYLDDVKLGQTPIVKQAVPVGSRKLRAVRADGVEQTQKLLMAPDDELDLGTLAW